MGGQGSGRRSRYDAKDTTDDYRVLDVRRLQREGLLHPPQSFGWQWSRYGEGKSSIEVRTEANRVVLTYRYRRNGGEWKDESYSVYLEWTPCNFGGSRPWFRCPAIGCGRRVATLYGGAIFACRHCHQLAYPSQNETEDDRAARRADKVRERLGWEPGILNGRGHLKPKGMHWRTFARLLKEYDHFEQLALSGMAQRFNLLP